MIRVSFRHAVHRRALTMSHAEHSRVSAVMIRGGHRSDAAGMLALEAHFPTDRMSLRSVRRFLSVPSSHVWIAESGGAVVGNLIWLSRRGSRLARIYSLVVSPAERGRQIAQRLVEAMEAEAAASGCTASTLEVREDNPAARALYAKLGYVEAARLPMYYEDGGDGLRLVHPLTPELT